MNKTELNHIMDILTLPFHTMEFGCAGSDCLTDYFLAFEQVIHTDYGNLAVRRMCDEKFAAARERLIRYICEHRMLITKSVDDVLMLLDLFYPRTEAADYLKRLKTLQKEEPSFDLREAFSGFYLDNLFRIANSLLTFRDGTLSIRTWTNGGAEEKKDIFYLHEALNKAEIWNCLCRKTVPDVYIAAFYLECGLTQVSYLYNQYGWISLADKSLGLILKKGLAETHMHFNVGYEYPALWNSATHLLFWLEQPEDAVMERGRRGFNGYAHPGYLFEASVFRFLFAEYLEHRERAWIGGDYGFACFVETEYPAAAGALFSLLDDMNSGREAPAAAALEALAEKIKNRYAFDVAQDAHRNKDLLLLTIYRQYQNINTTSENIFLLKLLCYLKEEAEDAFAKRLFLQYLRIKNDYFTCIIQEDSVPGLDYFQGLYKRASGGIRLASGDKRDKIRMVIQTQFQNPNLKKLEIRIAPEFGVAVPYTEPSMRMQGLERDVKLELLGQIEMILCVYRECMLNYLDPAQRGAAEKEAGERLDRLYEGGGIGLPTLGIVFHFLKKDSVDNLAADTCWLSLPEDIPADSGQILVWRNKMIFYAEALEKLRSEIPGLGGYLVGIDAASGENSTEPWVFAPVYLAVRNRKVTKPSLLEDGFYHKRLQNIGFTYHVGEEFRHILSGLRHVDEVVEHFNYKAGDRLGHAIALGTDVAEWIRRNEIVVMPLQEYLEDLIWLWGIVVHKKYTLHLELDYLEGEILFYARQLYGMVTGITPDALYEAYKNKFASDQRPLFARMSKKIRGGGEIADNGGHFCRYYSNADGRENLWTEDKLTCTNFCPIYTLRGQKAIFVKVRAEDENLYAAVQEAIVADVERLGIYVETNPTSNTAIGEGDGLYSHYITRLNNQGLKTCPETIHSVMATVNSDDPAVFNTNTENELAYIYHALIHAGYGKENVLCWIDKIRHYGMDSSFIHQVRKPSAILKEIGGILEEIDQFRRNG